MERAVEGIIALRPGLIKKSTWRDTGPVMAGSPLFSCRTAGMARFRIKFPIRGRLIKHVLLTAKYLELKEKPNYCRNKAGGNTGLRNDEGAHREAR